MGTRCCEKHDQNGCMQVNALENFRFWTIFRILSCWQFTKTLVFQPKLDQNNAALHSKLAQGVGAWVAH